jgi:hypothetical protein
MLMRRCFKLLQQYTAIAAAIVQASYVCSWSRNLVPILLLRPAISDEISYTLMIVRPWMTGVSGFFGALKSAGNSLAAHGEFGSKNAAREWNSMYYIIPDVPSPPKAVQMMEGNSVGTCSVYLPKVRG